MPPKRRTRVAHPTDTQLAGTLEPARIFDQLVTELAADYLRVEEQRRRLPFRRRKPCRA